MVTGDSRQRSGRQWHADQLDAEPRNRRPVRNYRRERRLRLNNLSGSPAIVTEQHQPGWRPTSPPFASYYIPDFANGTSYGAGNFLVQADATAPMVTAITPIGPTTTNANTVQFTVTFSEPVVRLLGLVTNPPTADNFGVVSSTLIGAGVTTVTGGGTTYTVTVNTGTGSGFLNLTFANSINVVDFGYNTVGNVGFNKAQHHHRSSAGGADRTGQRRQRPEVAGDEPAGHVRRGDDLRRRGSAAFQLTNNLNIVVPGVTLNVSPIDNSSGVSVVTVTFSGAPIVGGSLADGRYRLRMLASQVHGPVGNTLAFDAVHNFYRFYGDMTGDARVDIADFGFFSLAYLHAS